MDRSTNKPRTVLITGCSKDGIGDALVREYRRRGCRVIATARHVDKMANFKGMGIETLSLDVEDSESVRQAAAAVRDITGGQLDILVNNAGSGYTTTLLDTHVDTAKKMFDVNVFGPLELIQACAPLLIAAKGQIVNIGSVAGILQIPYQGMYNASKATMHVMTENLRLELSPFGVQVILVLTGGIKTNFFNNVQGDILPKGSLYEPAAEEVLPHLQGGQARRLEGTHPDDYARSVVKNSLSWRPRKRIWVGKHTPKAWLSTVMWYGFADPILYKMFGLDKVEAKLKQARGTK